MITSLDGCILLERWSKPAERVDFTQVYEATAKRLQGDGWIVGRITMAEYGQGAVSYTHLDQYVDPSKMIHPTPVCCKKCCNK